MNMLLLKPNTRLKLVTGVILMLAAILSIPFILYVARPNTPALDFFTFLFICLLIMPYFLLLLSNLLLSRTVAQAQTIFYATLINIFLAIAVFYYCFFLHVDGQYGLMLVIVPMLQIAISVIAGVMVYFKR